MDTASMDLRHLRYYQAVAEELNFSKAARRLRVTQPALSRAVQQIETELGVLLLRRTPKALSLTAAGAVFLDEIGLLLQRFEESIRRVQRTASGEEGEIRIGYIGPPTQRFLGRLLRHFRESNPRVSVVLEERTPERVWEMVAQGRLSLGFTRPVLGHQALGLRTLLLRREPLWAVIPSGHPMARRKWVAWRDLKDEPLVILSRREGVGLYDTIVSACRRARFTPKLAATPSLVNTVLSYVEAGAGIGVISDSVASLGAERPLKFCPLKPVQTVDLVMVWSDKEQTPAVAFTQLVVEWKNAGLLSQHRSK